MKKKILFGLFLFLILYVACSIYIAYMTDSMTTQYQGIVMLNHVEDLRRNLNGRFRRVQTNLRLLNTKFERPTDLMASDLSELQYYASSCIGCHHEQTLQNRLRRIGHEVDQYIDQYKAVIVLKSHNRRFEDERIRIFNTGSDLLDEINALTQQGSASLKLAISSSLRDLMASKRLVYMFLIISPAFIVVIALIFLMKVSMPLNHIINAVNQVKSGNLRFRMNKELPDEFGQIANTFNEMSQEMEDYIRRIDETNRRYRLLFESAADAIFIISAEGEDMGRIIDANEAAARMHGYTLEEFCNMRIQDIDVPEDAAKVSERIALITEGKPLRFEIRHYRKDGSEFPVEVTANLLELEGKKYVLAIDRDISIRKKTEEEMLRAEQLAASGRIAAGIAHEIKNPLAGIKAAVELILRKDDRGTISEDDSKTLRAIIDEIRRIEGLLKQILDYARPQQSHRMLININFVLDSTISLLLKQREFQDGTTVIRRDYDPSLPEVMIDPQQQRQVFMNLFLNAKDAMPQGGIIDVRTFYDSLKGQVLIEIADTGEGIDENFRDKLFIPFSTTKKRGTGLGLAICKQIVEANGGSISLKDNIPKGTVFAIAIPVSP